MDNTYFTKINQNKIVLIEILCRTLINYQWDTGGELKYDIIYSYRDD